MQITFAPKCAVSRMKFKCSTLHGLHTPATAFPEIMDLPQMVTLKHLNGVQRHTGPGRYGDHRAKLP